MECNRRPRQTTFVGIHRFPHRAMAAFAAIAERFRGLEAAALTAPPLSPPSLPRATAAGFLGFSSGCTWELGLSIRA
jgi:hypothetical protein